MKSHELDIFHIGWETPEDTSTTAKSIALEMQFVLEEKLVELLEPHKSYCVQVILSEMENKDAI